MDEPRKGRQTPTQSVVILYEQTHGRPAAGFFLPYAQENPP